MPSRFDIVTIDSPRPVRLADFWSRVLGLVVLEQEDGDRWILLGDADRSRRLGIQRGEHRPGGTHLDLRCEVEDFHDEAERLVDIGALLLSPLRLEPYGWIANLRDPDGNPFDLCAYVHP